MIRSIVVLGGGSAGLLAALTLKKKLPALEIEVVASSRIGVIGVGEGTTPGVPGHLHGYLGIPEHETFSALRPVFKMGVRFAWGQRDYFDYTFSGRQFAWRSPELSKNHGFMAWEDPIGTDLGSALMEAGKAAPRRPDRLPDLPPAGTQLAWHLENRTFVAWLEDACRRCGVLFRDAEMVAVERDAEGGVAALQFSDGARIAADLYLDSSGFASLLLGGALAEPFEDFSDRLFCDRAVAGGWEREDEPVLPYTLSETMPAGWAWRIDHPERIHRGYVFSSDHLTDEQATEEFLRKNPRAPESPRIVKFRSGAYKQQWVNNVVAIGNSAGFVEPLEATALMIACGNVQTLVDLLIDSDLAPSEACRKIYNASCATGWKDIKNFLALHYWADRSKHNAFWDRCRNETDVSEITDFIEFYQLHGPSGALKQLLSYGGSDFGLEGWLAILVGNKVPHQGAKPTKRELDAFHEYEQKNLQKARSCMDVKTALQYVHHPGWNWNADQMAS